MTSYLATGPNYIATIPAALGLSDARQIACKDSGLMPWEIKVKPTSNLRQCSFQYGCIAETTPSVVAAKTENYSKGAM